MKTTRTNYPLRRSASGSVSSGRLGSGSGGGSVPRGFGLRVALAAGRARSGSARGAARRLAVTAVAAAAASRGRAVVHLRRLAGHDGAAVRHVELGAVVLLHGVEHVLFIRIFHNTTSSAVNVRIDDVSTASHEIFQILPAGSLGQAAHGDAVRGALGLPVVTFPVAPAAVVLRHLHAQPLAVEAIAVSVIDGVLGIAAILESLDEA